MTTPANELPLSMAGTGGYAVLGPDEERRARYQRIAQREIEATRIERFEIPARDGLGVAVEAGRVLRIACADGPQVADFIAFNAHDRHCQIKWA